MTSYEIARIVAEPFLPVLCGKVRSDLKRLVRRTPARPVKVLDVGGRKSPYTIGLPAVVTVLDLPRENEIQCKLNLGVSSEIKIQLRRRRSNIDEVFLQDMTKCTLPPETFDGVVGVEVIEHIRDEDAFLSQIFRVLKPRGWLYLTTPNGDYVRNAPPNYNPDHVRLYTRQALLATLGRYFEGVEVTWGIKTGKYRYRGLMGMNPLRPIRSAIAMGNNVINRVESHGLENQPRRTAHLFAVAWNPNRNGSDQTRQPA